MSGACKTCAYWFGPEAKQESPLGECAMIGVSSRLPLVAEPVMVVSKNIYPRFFTPSSFGCKEHIEKGSV